MAEPRTASPLAHLASGAATGDSSAAVTLTERALLGKVGLRGDASDPAFVQTIASVLGASPPISPNTVTRGSEATLLWLGPDEWLAVTSPGKEADAIARLDGAFAGRHASAIDVSDARTTIRLAGPRAADVLAKGCPLDLHPHVFAPGTCAQSSIAKASVLIHRLDEPPAFDIYVAASFAEYLWVWLQDAAREFDGPT
jgi:sarcosine oxidase subunit gamma